MRNPQPGKQGARISGAKYEMVCAAILDLLRAEGVLTFGELTSRLEEKLKGSFEGSVPWYVTSVKLDLEARGILERVPNSKPQRLRLADQKQ